MLVKVERGEFLHEITEQGDVESASNVEIRCEVQALGTSGTTILWIIPEGTYVQPGEKLVELDQSSLEDNALRQEIAVASSDALRIQADNDLECAKIALKEYVEGTLQQDLMTIENEKLLAEENSKRAKDYANYSEQLAAKGFVTKVQLEADRFAVKKAEQDKILAERKRDNLLEYTSDKMKRQLEANIKTAEAKLKAQTDSHTLENEKLKRIRTQLEKCVIRAPEAGQVVYANQRDNRGGNEIIIEEGTLVRERQVIIRLPDPKRMQVTAKINEAKISQVVVGMPATVRMDAFPDVEMTGKVKKVNEYPAPTSWFNSRVKEYDTVVTIENPPPGLRPGLTAEVKILVAQVPDALQLPVQAVFEREGQHYAILHQGDEWTAQPIEIGRTNDKFVIIREGLQAGREVVLNTANYRDRLQWPETPAESPGTPSPGAVASSDAGKEKGTDPPAPSAELAVARAPSGDASGPTFQQLDQNRDGKLQADELPETIRLFFASADTNHDGSLDRDEFLAVLNRQGPTAGGAGKAEGRSNGSRRGIRP